MKWKLEAKCSVIKCFWESSCVCQWPSEFTKVFEFWSSHHFVFLVLLIVQPLENAVQVFLELLEKHRHFADGLSHLLELVGQSVAPELSPRLLVLELAEEFRVFLRNGREGFEETVVQVGIVHIFGGHLEELFHDFLVVPLF